VSGAVLIFPAGHPGGEEGRAQALAEGRPVVGASSLDYDPARAGYEVWEQLPFVSDPGFGPALSELIARHGVDAVHTPHYVVWRHLNAQLSSLAPGVELRGGPSLLDTEEEYRRLRARFAAPSNDAFYAPALPPRPPLGELERAGLMRLLQTISGMSSEEKLLAILDVMRCAPEGDVVEVGSWWGKSAAAFAVLARRYGVGPVLCVDPWASEALPQGDAILDEASASADMDEALRIFQINLAPIARGELNYLRVPSAEGARRYGPGLRIETETFGEVRYAGEIAVLHIDGNHTLHHAEEDARLWTPHVKPGGWIIFDDYVWVFGDGPQRVGDAFLEREAGRIQLSFVAGKALFVQLKTAP
jgi:hypothetical protein